MRSGNEILRASCDAGKCEEIYDSADIENHMQWFPNTDGSVWIEGTAKFERETCKFRTDWEVTQGAGRLFNIELKRPRGLVNVPGFSGRLVD